MAEALSAYQEATSLLNGASPEVLIEVCQHLKLKGYEEIDETKENKMSLLRKITRHLNGEDIEEMDDQGEQIFRGVCALLQGRDQDQQKRNGITLTESLASTPKPESQVIHVTKKEFKISGQIGEPGQRDRLSFSSLIHQIESAAKKGYGDEDIVEAVVRAVVPGSALRSYLEGLPELTLPVLRRMLRAHFQEKGATDLYHRLSRLSQDQKESAQSFLVRALDLRQKVVFASKEAGSGIKYDPTLVQSMLLHALMTGFRSEAVKNEVRPLLESSNTTDEELFEKVNEAAGRETERQEKLGNSYSRKVNAHSISQDLQDSKGAESACPKPKPREGTLMDEIAVLRAGMADVAVIKEQITNMQAAFSKHNSDPQASQQRRRRTCANCENKGISDNCDHCFRCGSAEHFARGCRKRYNQNRTGNGERLLPRDEQ